MRSSVSWLALATLATLAAAGCTGPSERPVPAGLQFASQPVNTTAGVLFTITVQVVDKDGALVPSAGNSVTLTLGANPGLATLTGLTTVTAVNGVATFANLSLNRTGTGYTFVASSSGLTPAMSGSFNVGAGPAFRLDFQTQPSQAISGLGINPAVAVAVKDAAGNTVTGATPTITIGIGANAGGATLSGTRVVAAVSGVATFMDLILDKAGTGYTLIATAPTLPAATSVGFTVIAGAPTRLEFAVQPPASAPTDAPLNPIVIAVRDVNGNATNATGAVTIALGTNPGGAVLSGTTTVNTAAGLATFSTLRLNNPGAGYTLVASALGLSGATSNPFTIRASLDFTAVSAGYFHACGIAPGSQAYCWGENNGKLGNGTINSSSFPVVVQNGIAFVSISAGRNHSCGLTAAGVAYCWGLNGIGELGDGTSDARLVPTPVAGGLSFASLSAGYDHTCGVTVAGTAYCWGSNGSGELGDGTQQNRFAPVQVSGGFSFLSVSPGRFFTCGVTTSNAAYCWGTNSNGELGNGGTTLSKTPLVVSGGLTFTAVGAGGFHACGLTTGGPTYCWGSNFAGELGNGTLVASSVPVQVSGGLVLASLSVGNRHNCGLTAAGVAYCWGDNVDANLGDGTTTPRLVPTPVSGGLTFTRVSAGRFHSCGVTPGNAAYCWGSNFAGQVGSGPPQLVPAPLRVR